MGPAEARRLFLVMALDGVLGAMYPDGRARWTRAASRWRWPTAPGSAARDPNRDPVLRIGVRDGRVHDVETTAGTIRADVV